MLILYRLITILIVIAVVSWIFAGPAHAGDTVHAWITDLITFMRHTS